MNKKEKALTEWLIEGCQKNLANPRLPLASRRQCEKDLAFLKEKLTNG